MTLDMIFMLLADKENLRAKGTRSKRIESLAAIPMSGKDGLVAGRDEHGKPIRAKVAGESLVKRLNREVKEAEEAKKRIGCDLTHG